jgi:hypothetical protein
MQHVKHFTAALHAKLLKSRSDMYARALGADEAEDEMPTNLSPHVET